jgi:hypothetical protein
VAAEILAGFVTQLGARVGGTSSVGHAEELFVVLLLGDGAGGEALGEVLAALFTAAWGGWLGAGHESILVRRS